MKLTFNTLEKAQIALNQININKGYSIPSKNAKNKKIDLTVQQTEKWDIIKKVNNIEIWYFEKPNEEFMQGVQDYEEQEVITNG